MADHRERLNHDPLAWLAEEAAPEPAPAAVEPAHPASPTPPAVPAVAEAPEAITPPRSAEPSGVVELEEMLTVAQAGDLQGVLLRELDGRAEVVVDGSRVERVDAAALQVLAAFSATLRHQGGQITWQRPSASLCEGVTLTGLGELLGLEGCAAHLR